MGGEQSPEAYVPVFPEPDTAPVAAMTAPTNSGDIDKVSEEKMAELLGTTKRALQARRARKQIPEWVWVKVGIASGDTMNGSKANGYAHRGGTLP